MEEFKTPYLGPSFKDLATETNWQILLSLDADTMLNLCQTNKDFAYICENQRLWEARLKQERGKNVQQIPGKTWKQTYLEVRAKELLFIEIGNKGTLMGQMWISLTSTVSDIAKSVAVMFSLTNVKYLIMFTEGYRYDGTVLASYTSPLGSLVTEKLTRIDVSDEWTAPILIVFPPKDEQFFWITERTTIGEFTDAVNKYKPIKTLWVVVMSSQGFPYEDPLIITSDLQARAMNARDFFRDRRIQLPYGFVASYK